MWEKVLDFVFPKLCVGCGKWDTYMCEQCEIGMEEEEQICPVCARGSRYGQRHKYCHKSWSLDGVSCFWKYEGVTRKLITEAKYQYYFDQLRELAVSSWRLTERDEFVKLRKFLEERPAVVPVPLHQKRLTERGFNQAALIGKQVASLWSLDFSDMLIKIKDTGHQVGKSREERLKNLQGAFAVRASSGQRLASSVLLVDDVWTTGATLSECCEVLKRAGVQRVWGLVLAR